MAFSWLMKNIGTDSIGKVVLTDLHERIKKECDLNISKKKLTQDICCLYPSTIVAYEFNKELKKKVTVYKGIYWIHNIKKSTNRNIDWTDIYALLPSYSLLLSNKVSHEIVFALKSSVTVNGAMVMKEVYIKKDLMQWGLRVRGKTIDLHRLHICSKFHLTEEKVYEIIKTVERLQVCTGIDAKDFTTTSDKILKEMCTIGEDKSYLAVRSDHCEQIVSISSKTVCKNCRLFRPMNTCDERRGHINTKTQESDHNTSCMFTDNKENNNEGKITEINCDENNITSCEEGITESPNEILLDDNDHDDLSEILKSVFPGASENFKKLLESQHKALSAKSPSSRRWDKKIISICLSLWIRSPKAYATLQDSGMLILPSGRQLRRYKNCVPQETGIHDKILTWMREAALDAKVPPHGFCGGLHHDETKVQRDLILNMNDGKPVLIGWIDMGEESFNLKVLKDNEVKPELANEVLQVSFVGFTGFRFPICHFPTAGVKASDLHIIIWNCISKLWDYGFEVDYIMQDGGEENRTFMKMHFPDDPIKCNYGSPNIFLRGKNLFHTQDFSHNVKKLRNSILKSGTIKGQHTRLIMKNGKYITWRHWEKAVEWDRLTNSRRLHYKISESHLHPNIAEKMRNELAESMLNTDMLNLMESYAQSLPDSDFLTSSISLLQQTSKLIAIFRDSRLITNVNDKRLKDLTDIYYWFANWDKEIKESTSIPDNQKSKSLPSKECMNDIMCMLTSFPAVCIQHLNQFPEGSIKPSRFNNDVAENIFCQQKGLYNGNNGNPTYFNYSKSVNSIILGQSLKSRGRKSNAGLDSAKQFSNYSDEPVTKKPKLHKKCILPTKSSSSCDFTAKCKENYIRI